MNAGESPEPGGLCRSRGLTHLHQTASHGISPECSARERSATEQFSVANSILLKRSLNTLLRSAWDPIGKTGML